MSATAPTADYTGYVWARNGLSHPELETRLGRILFESLQPTMKVNHLLGGTTLEEYLLARHRGIDALLERAIDRDGLNQVIELACGLSPRGWRFVQRHRDLVYVETDLPEVAAQKRRALERMGSLGERHRVAEVDVLRDEDLMAVAGELDRSRPLAVITEGLLTYLPWDSVDGMWRGLSRLLSGFAAGRYISDIHLRSMQTVQRRAFRVLLAAFVRGKVYVHFDHTDDVKEALTAAGFTGAEVIAAGSLLGSAAQRGSRTNILEASTK